MRQLPWKQFKTGWQKKPGKFCFKIIKGHPPGSGWPFLLPHALA